MSKHHSDSSMTVPVVVDDGLPPHKVAVPPGNYRVGALEAFEESDPTLTDYDEAEKLALTKSEEVHELDFYDRAYAVWDMDRDAFCVVIAYRGWLYMP